MKITYDKKADAIYIYLSAEMDDKERSVGIIAETKGDWPVHLDFSKDDKLLGVEILQASKMVNVKYLKRLIFERID